MNNSVNMDYIASIRMKMSANGLYPKGSGSNDIKAAEKKLNIQIPEALRQFYEYMGNDYDGIFRGTDRFLCHLTRDRSCLLDLYGWDQVSFPIPNDAVIFYSHQGYSVGGYLLSESSGNPVVYHFAESTEAANAIPIRHSSFIDFMKVDIDGLLEQHS